MGHLPSGLAAILGWEARGNWPWIRQRRLRSAFDEWARQGKAAAMAGRHAWLARAVFERLQLRPGDRVLELGCGNGWACASAAAAVGPMGAVLGVDVSPAMIAEARAQVGAASGGCLERPRAERASPAANRRPPSSGQRERPSEKWRATFICAPAHELPVADRTFTHAFSIEAFYYCRQRPTLAELRRVLVPGGRLCLALCYFTENTAAGSWRKRLALPMTLASAEEYRELLRPEDWAEVICEPITAGPVPTSAHDRALLVSARRR
jgi:SAM-dependent methyltransferase